MLARRSAMVRRKDGQGKVRISRAHFPGMLLGAMFFLLAPMRGFATVSVTISPSSVNLTPSETQQFAATVTGASDTSVVWTIQEGAPGGTITGAGLYSAPGVVGVYHVIATSNADPTQSATATVGVPGFVQTGLLYTGPCTSTLLANGTILFTGGSSGGGGESANAEIYDPVASKSTPTGKMTMARCGETATLLPNGQVLFAGGQISGETNIAEIYDPVAGTFHATGSMSLARINHTATLLPNGTVLIAGGSSCTVPCATPGFSNTAEVYDPSSGMFIPTPGTMVVAASSSKSILLNNGKVLIAGGFISGGAGTTVAELYDPSTGMFTQTGPMGNPRSQFFTATLLQNGTVLFAGGGNATVTATAEVYDPTSQQFSPTGSLSLPLEGHSATLLGNGQVLIAGGGSTNSYPTAAQLYDPVAGAFKPTGGMQERRFNPFATLLANGTVAVAGGSFTEPLSSIEIYDPAAGTFSSKSTYMNAGRTGNTLTKLADGRFLFVGGLDDNNNPILNAEIFDPATNKFTLTGALAAGRYWHTATLLGDGTVLVVGGLSDYQRTTIVSTAEIYNPVSGAFGLAPSNPIIARVNQTATMLPNGKVFIAGGTVAGGNYNPPEMATASVEIFDPSAGTFTLAGNMTVPREGHTATLLSDGRVFLAEGVFDTTAFSTGAMHAPDELYDPVSGSFTPVGAPEFFAVGPNPQPLPPFDSLQWPNGEVLVDTLTLFNPTSLSLSTFFGPAAGVAFKFVLLPSNQVFVVGGGTNSGGPLYTTFLINPNPSLLPQSQGSTFSTAGNLNYSRLSPSAALLPDGEVLIASGTTVNQAEFYVPPVPASAPVISSVSPNPISGFTAVPITVQGANFTSGSVITLDFAPLVTTILSTTQLTAVIPATTLTAPGPHTIWVLTGSSLSSGPFTLTVNNPQLGVSQPNGSGITYVNIPVGTSSSQSVNFQNSGNAPLTVDSLTITGANSADFQFDMANTSCPLQGGTLAPLQVCTATVLFVPASDAQFTAALNFAYETLPGSPFVVPLSGTGAGQVSSTVTPSSLTFASQGVATGSSPQSVTIVSTGNPNLQFTSVVLTDTTDFSMVNQCQGQLGPNASCSIAITFMPSKAGNITGSIVITTNEIAAQTVPLSGIGETFSIAPASGSTTSSTVTAGHTANYQLSISSHVFSGSVTLICAPVTAIPNATCSVAPNPVTLVGINQTAVTVSVTTAASSGMAVPSLQRRHSGPGAYPMRASNLLYYLLLSLALIAASMKFRHRIPLALSATLLLIVLAAACGNSGGSSGGGGSTGTPAGNYQFVVTASASGMSSSTTLTLTVQ